MIWDFYINYEKDRKSFLEEFLPLAEKEMDWWQGKRSVSVTKKNSKTGKPHTLSLYQYRAETNCPRPENFLEDYQMGIQSGENVEFYWSSTASACESGLDFSTRWFDMEGQNTLNRKGMRTNLVIPVDLNVFMALNFRALSKLYGDGLGNKEKSQKYSKMADKLQETIKEVFFDENTGVWFDYDLEANLPRKKFFPSNIYPLMLNTTTVEGCEKVLGYLKDLDVFKYKGGIPSSLEESSKEQWDFPNGWAPINHLFVVSLLHCKQDEALQLAKKVADGFLTTIYNGLLNPIKGLPAQVWEKYDVRFDNGRSGFGGEYPVQAGFGWTNGAALDFIRYFYTGTSQQLYPDSLENVIRRTVTTNVVIRPDDQREPKLVPPMPDINFMHTSIVISAVLFCAAIVAVFLYVQFVRNKWKRGPSATSRFWNTRGPDDTAMVGSIGVAGTRMRKNPESEHRLLLNSIDDDSSGMSE
ncbi:trehalase domain-containing protein [Ditylenchus destructor]|nr:trehalase domain-containing protein [Ditylenchus destructor]